MPTASPSCSGSRNARGKPAASPPFTRPWIGCNRRASSHPGGASRHSSVVGAANAITKLKLRDREQFNRPDLLCSRLAIHSPPKWEGDRCCPTRELISYLGLNTALIILVQEIIEF